MITGLNITVMQKDPMHSSVDAHRFYWKLYSRTQCIATSYKAWPDEGGARRSARRVSKGMYNPIRVNRTVRKDPSPYGFDR